MDHELDTRNVMDKYKTLSIETIVKDLDAHEHGLQIAVENLDRDYNMGTVIRNANAFGVRHVHIIGRRQWNKRGAMMTDKYLHVHYHESVAQFLAYVSPLPIVAVDNVKSSTPLKSVELPTSCVMVFGSEGAGLSEELLIAASEVVAIEQLGSTRSINVGVAAGIAMYTWLARHVL